MQQDSKRISWKLAIWLMGLLVIAVVGYSVLVVQVEDKSKPFASPPYAPGFDNSQQVVPAEINKEEVQVMGTGPAGQATNEPSLMDNAYAYATRVWEPRLTQAAITATPTHLPTRVLIIPILPTPLPKPTGTMVNGLYFQEFVPKSVDPVNIWRGFVNENFTVVYAGNLRPLYAVGETEPTNYGIVYIRQDIEGSGMRQVSLTTETMPPPWQEPEFLRIIDDYFDSGTLYLSIEGGNGAAYILNLDTYDLFPVDELPQTLDE
jgi:hypothetical protein